MGFRITFTDCTVEKFFTNKSVHLETHLAYSNFKKCGNKDRQVEQKNWTENSPEGIEQWFSLFNLIGLPFSRATILDGELFHAEEARPPESVGVDGLDGVWVEYEPSNQYALEQESKRICKVQCYFSSGYF